MFFDFYIKKNIKMFLHLWASPPRHFTVYKLTLTIE